MTVENIWQSISTKECCQPRRGLNPRPPGLQSDGASNWATEASHFVYAILSSKLVCKILGQSPYSLEAHCQGNSHEYQNRERKNIIEKKISITFGWIEHYTVLADLDFVLTLKTPRKPSSENVVCLCCLLNILANFSNLFYAYRQTVWTQIRRLLKEPSDLGPHFAKRTFKIRSRWESRRQLLWLAV